MTVGDALREVGAGATGGGAAERARWVDARDGVRPMEVVVTRGGGEALRPDVPYDCRLISLGGRTRGKASRRRGRSRGRASRGSSAARSRTSSVRCALCFWCLLGVALRCVALHFVAFRWVGMGSFCFGWFCFGSFRFVCLFVCLFVCAVVFVLLRLCCFVLLFFSRPAQCVCFCRRILTGRAVVCLTNARVFAAGARRARHAALLLPAVPRGRGRLRARTRAGDSSDEEMRSGHDCRVT